jgi:hypothetical protein
MSFKIPEHTPNEQWNVTDSLDRAREIISVACSGEPIDMLVSSWKDDQERLLDGERPRPLEKVLLYSLINAVLVLYQTQSEEDYEEELDDVWNNVATQIVGITAEDFYGARDRVEAELLVE